MYLLQTISKILRKLIFYTIGRQPATRGPHVAQELSWCGPHDYLNFLTFLQSYALFVMLMEELNSTL